MKKFSEIAPVKSGNLTGTKYHIDKILNLEIHLKGYSVKPSKYEGDALTLQYDIYEPMTDNNGPVIDDDGRPVMGWVEHITFTGSKALMRQLDGVEIIEPIRAKIIKQPIDNGKRCFYKLVDPDD